MGWGGHEKDNGVGGGLISGKEEEESRELS